MKTCPRCGKQYEDDQAYCGVDGASLSGSLRTPSGSDSRTLRTGALIGGYRVSSVIGKGGMGIVYAAEHARLGKKVAVKVLRAELVEDEGQVARFFHEARAANSVGHENIVEVHDFIEEGPQRAFVMELLEGTPLSREMAHERPLPPPRIARIARQIADALAAVHEQRIVHRDLKPDNIFLTTRARQNDFVKLLDFGVAKLLEAEGEGLTQAGTVIGTPAYMAPEQLKGEPVDARADIYSLGVILYQMASGKRPFKGKSIPELMMKQVTDAPPPLVDVGTGPIPPSLVQLIFQCLEKDRERRPKDMREVERRLASLEMVVGVSASGQYPALPEPTVRPPLVPGAAPPRRDSGPVARPQLVAPDAPTPGTMAPASDAGGSAAASLAGQTAAEEAPISSIASMLEQRRALSWRALVGGVAVVVVVAACVAAWLLRPPPAQPSASLTVRVESTPPGAEIRFGEVVLGVTPADIVLARTMVGGALELRLAGHTPAVLQVPASPGVLARTLSRAAAASLSDGSTTPPAQPPDGAAAAADTDAAPADSDAAAAEEPPSVAPPASDDPGPPVTTGKRRRPKPRPPSEPDRKRPSEAPVDPFR